jgi:hypothetical protein
MISQKDELSEAIEDLKAHLIQGEHELKKLKQKRILET